MNKRIENMTYEELVEEFSRLRDDPLVRKVLKALMIRDELQQRKTNAAHDEALQSVAEKEMRDREAL